MKMYTIKTDLAANAVGKGLALALIAAATLAQAKASPADKAAGKDVTKTAIKVESKHGESTVESKIDSKTEPKHGENKTQPKHSDTKSESKQNVKHTEIKRGRIMIPPPPPEIPLLSPESLHDSFSSGLPVEYLSKPDLERMQAKIENELDRLQKSHDEKKQDYDEQKQKVDSFDALYKEGVVSRKEITTARRDLEEAERQLSSQDSTLKDLAYDLDKVKKQLAVLKARSDKKEKAGLKEKKSFHKSN
jgi:hypothetical protein